MHSRCDLQQGCPAVINLSKASELWIDVLAYAQAGRILHTAWACTARRLPPAANFYYGAALLSCCGARR